MFTSTAATKLSLLLTRYKKSDAFAGMGISPPPKEEEEYMVRVALNLLTPSGRRGR